MNPDGPMDSSPLPRPRSRLKRWTIIALFLLVAVLYFTVSSFSESTHRSLAILSMGDVEALRTYILQDRWMS